MEFLEKVERHTPNDILKPFIKTFMTIESRNGMVNRILPDTSITMAFRYRGTTYAGIDGQAGSDHQERQDGRHIDENEPALA